jgi:hypothetical protein
MSYTLADLKQAVRNGDTERVREISQELVNNGVLIISALELAENLNKTKGKRGKWNDIIEVLEEHFEDDDVVN